MHIAIQVQRCIQGITYNSVGMFAGFLQHLGQPGYRVKIVRTAKPVVRNEIVE